LRQYQSNIVKVKVFSQLSTVSLMLSSCANIVTPTGGPRDTQAPTVVEATPENLSTRFTWNKVTILFDEYVKLDNPAQEIIISPSIRPEPKIQVKGKKLEIEFKDAILDSNTTYTINFGESLKDANESNVLNNFQYVFSTGDIVDSLYVLGKVVQAKDDKPAAKVLVMLYKEMGDSVLLKNRPFYFTKTSDDGGFQFSHISGGEYQLFALKDENFNYIYDLPNEEVAFWDSVVTVDTNEIAIRLNIFSEEREVQLQRIGMDDSKPGFIKLIYSKSVSELEVNSFEDGEPVAVPEYNKTRDTILAWYTQANISDSLRLMINKDSVEKITVRNIPANNESLKKMFSQFTLVAKDSLIASEGSIATVLNHPTKIIEFDRVVVEQDSPQIEIKPTQVEFEDGSSRHISLDFPRKAETKYSIIFPAGIMTDYFGTTNDTLVWMVKTKSDEDYGSLDISITGQEEQHYVMQMVNLRNETFVKEQA